MTGHSGAVMELHFSPDGNHLYTASTDMTLGLWDIVAGTRIKKLKGHTSFVNSVSGARRGPTLLCSGSDDSTIRIWDPRKRGQCHTLNNTYQVSYLDLNNYIIVDTDNKYNTIIICINKILLIQL